VIDKCSRGDQQINMFVCTSGMSRGIPCRPPGIVAMHVARRLIPHRYLLWFQRNGTLALPSRFAIN
jgi:hypothetical protein